MADLLNLTKEQKKIVADLYSPDEEVVVDTLYRIREVGGEYCIAPMIDVFFSTPFANVRIEIGRVFLDLKSAKVSKQILDSLAKYMEHELIGEFITNLWQSSVVFDDVVPFVEKFVVADDMLALDCLSLVENNLGNITNDSLIRSREIVRENYQTFDGMKKQLAMDLISILESGENYEK
ncbi:MAG: hypothetical protein J5709_07640 [Bacteroidales bacterium]|nr:hypothetical protein [Bacteroidales bacterium]